MNGPDWDRIKAISAEKMKLIDTGEWDKAAFLRLYGELEETADNFNGVFESLYLHAEPEWLEKVD